jgi:hypothetical protein
VVLLKSRPGTRFQLLGMVEAKAANRRSASAGLAIRGSMMGADAVVDLHQERLPGFWRTEHRASGMAVRAVDDEGRLELKTRWFSGQVGQVAMIMLAVAALELCADVAGVLGSSTGDFLSAMGAFCFAGLAAGLAFWKWPRLVRPTAFCFLAKVVQTVLGFLATLEGAAIMGFAALGTSPAAPVQSAMIIGAGLGVVATVIFGTLLHVSFLVFYLYLGRRAWRIDQEYRSLAGQSLALDKLPASRLWVSRLAWAAALFYAVVLIGSAAFNLYGGVIALWNMPKGPVVFTSSTGVKITYKPDDLHTNAWKFATDPDPSARNPAEAVRLAERAVAADAKNCLYLKTLGVARYRAGDFSGSIEALKGSIDSEGLNGDDAFFLAMAQARLGRHAEALEWYEKADQWMRTNESSDAEVKRFREEAAAVLDVVAGKPIEAKPAPVNAPASNDAAPATKPK